MTELDSFQLVVTDNFHAFRRLFPGLRPTTTASSGCPAPVV